MCNIFSEKMKFALSCVLLVASCVVVGAAPQKSSSDVEHNAPKDDNVDDLKDVGNVKDDSPARNKMVEKVVYSDKNCTDVVSRQFYETDMVSCGYYSSGQCGSNGEIGSHMYTCPAQETELDMKEYARLDAYDTGDCSGAISSSIYFPRKNAGKCIAYDTSGNSTVIQFFELEGDTISVDFSGCHRSSSFTKGKCVDKFIAHL